MRILLTGILVFVIWTLFSTWLYVNKLQPAMTDAQVTEQQSPEPEPGIQADTTTVMPPKKIPEDLVFYFDFDDATVHASQQNQNGIQEFKEWISENDSVEVTITGHTDNKGTDDYNMKLGMERAVSTMNFLSGKGVGANMLTLSQGERQPVSDQSTEEGRAKNRRTIVTLKK